VSCPLRFPGQYHDRETGLAYNLHRYYDPENARYQSPDPLGITPQPNPHAYVHNPTARIDPLGLAPYAPDAPAGTVRAYRWGDRTDPGALLPNLAKHGTESDREVHLLQLGRDANYLRWRAKRHAVGFTEKSPFVSVAGDADRAAVAEDPWLRDIATRSPDLAVLDVPGDRLVIPQIATSSRETEMLYLGDDLPDHLVGWVPNPYRGSGPG
jgi:RHS repeat-associated protein